MLAKYDQDVVKNLMPLIVNVLGKTAFNIRIFDIQYGMVPASWYKQFN
jgi:hypothetical protein